tara:strand:- start:34 stop:240 length:207 start_codon:yes stop_codon:yes gene_type:complete
MLLTGYASKKELKASIGEPLKYEETSIFGDEYRSNGSFVGARRPHLLGGGREFFAQVTMENDLIVKVE